MAASPSVSLCFNGLILSMVVCAMRPAAGQDLNANSVEDARDIRLGTSGDCNVNGFVDERDAAAPHLDRQRD